jgi:hypothetical protein
MTCGACWGGSPHASVNALGVLVVSLIGFVRFARGRRLSVRPRAFSYRDMPTPAMFGCLREDGFSVELDPESVRVLARAIALELHQQSSPPPREGHDGGGARFITRKEARALGVEERALKRAERAGELASFKLGKRVLYRERDVVAWIESHEVLPDAPVPCVVLDMPVPSDPFEAARMKRRLAR